jgi:uncharacterized protein (TIGR00159 family)
MFDTVSAAIRELVQSFGLADAADISVIALIIYAILVWVRETASYRVLIGLMVLACVYLLARSFNMVLTAQLLHTSVAVLLIVLAVIFQDDLRRGLERVATVGAWRVFRRQPAKRVDVDMLVETAFSLASRKIGALIVLPGTDIISRHAHGGIELSGRVSRPLLESLFDPHSAGHDGAVVIEDGRVTSFAVHLPISKNLTQVGTHGTRHAAALGLSEQTDALVLVVSEERGVVSVAQQGKLKKIGVPAILKSDIESFARSKLPMRKEKTWTRLVVSDWRSKFISVAMAAMAWLLLAYNPSTVQRIFDVPIEYRNVPPALELGVSAPLQTRVTLSGTEPAYRLLEPATLKISIDLSNAVEGVTTKHLTPKNLIVPSNLSVYRVEHATIALVLRKRDATPPLQPAAK